MARRVSGHLRGVSHGDDERGEQPGPQRVARRSARRHAVDPAVVASQVGPSDGDYQAEIGRPPSQPGLPRKRRVK